MLSLILRVLAEPTVVPVPRAIASGYICSRCVLAEPKIVCVRRKSNPRCDPGIYFAVWYGCAALFVGLDVQSRVVLLPELCVLGVFWPSLGLYVLDVNRTRDAIPVYTLLCGTAVLPCAWA